MTRTPEEIMTERLLTGGKMLNEMCSTCGAPLFEIKGVKQCVVCAENKKTEAKVEGNNKKIENKSDFSVIVPKYASGNTGFTTNQITDTIDSVIMMFLNKAKEEVDPARCLTLMECVRTAAEAKTILARF